MNLIYFICGFLFLMNGYYAKKILAMHQVYAGSHIFPVRKILQELVNRGNQVEIK